jgi:hypothetical protein
MIHQLNLEVQWPSHQTLVGLQGPYLAQAVLVRLGLLVGLVDLSVLCPQCLLWDLLVLAVQSDLVDLVPRDCPEDRSTLAVPELQSVLEVLVDQYRQYHLEVQLILAFLGLQLILAFLVDLHCPVDQSNLVDLELQSVLEVLEVLYHLYLLLVLVVQVDLAHLVHQHLRLSVWPLLNQLLSHSMKENDVKITNNFQPGFLFFIKLDKI